jgi:hypothetical protein
MKFNIIMHKNKNQLHKQIGELSTTKKQATPP